MSGGRLSAVDWPATRMASFIDHEPLWGSRLSRRPRESEYISVTASIAPGARAAECASGIGEPGRGAPHSSG